MERKLQMGMEWYGSYAAITILPTPHLPISPSTPIVRSADWLQIGWLPVDLGATRRSAAVAVGERTPGSWQRRSPSMVAGLLLLAALGAVAPSDKAKNFVIMLADDMGCASLLFFNLLPLRLD